MSIPEVYITSAITGSGPAVIRAQLTQFFDLKVRIPRKGHRTADLRVNLQSPELAPLYSGIGFETYRNFLYIIWRGQVVYWGPILIKEADFEESSLTIHSTDQGARLEHHYFRIGDAAMGVGGDSTIGNLPVGYNGLGLCLDAGYVGSGIPLGIRMGSDSHSGTGQDMRIERGQEVWRVMMDMGDRTDGPLFDLKPLSLSDGNDFAVLNAYNQFRTDRSNTVKLHYNTGLKNVRNMNLTTGGQVLSHVHVITANKHWRGTTISGDTMNKYGTWIRWETVDWDLRDDISESEAVESLGAVGDAILDAYGRPLTSVEVTLRRDDELGASSQFYWLTNFNVSDIIELQGVKGGESFSGKYQIDEVRLEQESDNSGQVRQAMDVIPWVTTGQYRYHHSAEFVEDEVHEETT